MTVNPRRRRKNHISAKTILRRARLLLNAAFFIAVTSAFAQSTSSVTLAWDSSSSSSVTGYGIYYGGATKTYTNHVDVGNATTAIITGLRAGTTYYFAAVAYASDGIQSAFSSEISYTVSATSAPGLVLTAPGTITAPFTASNGLLSQAVNSDVTTGGRAVYTVNIPAAGDYQVSAMVIAPNVSQNSFYINFDYYPTDPTMIWDVALTATLASEPVTWRGTGTDASDQFSPKIFTLTQGTHQLIIVGREGNTQLGTITITPVGTTTTAPTIALTSPADGAGYSAPASIPLAATVSTNGHTINKVQFYNGATLLGEASAPPYSFGWDNVAAGSYTLTATLVYDTSSSTSSSAATVNVTAPSPVPLTFASTSGAITAPFTASNGLLSQAINSDVTNGGRAVYTVNIPAAGDYQVSAMVIAPNVSQNSFYINFDSDPTDPAMIWDVALTATLASEPVTWRGTGTDASDQFSPKIFTLAQGTHQLIILGREGNTQLGTITITPVSTITTAPTIALTSPADGAGYSPPVWIPLAATVTPHSHTTTKVQFFNGVGASAEATNALYSFARQNAAAGAHPLTAKAIYDAGTVVPSSPSTISLNNPVDLPAPGQTMDIGRPGATGSASVSKGIYFVTGAGVLGRASD
ncbi:MAG: Ig-like domain-containing protein, partial [Limisphaerales bacterium]